MERKVKRIDRRDTGTFYEYITESEPNFRGCGRYFQKISLKDLFALYTEQVVRSTYSASTTCLARCSSDIEGGIQASHIGLNHRGYRFFCDPLSISRKLASTTFFTVRVVCTKNA